MTNEEAKCYIRTLLEVGGCDGFDYKQKEALDLAIKALEAQPKKGKWKGYTHYAYHGTDDMGEPIWREVIVYHCSECKRRTVIKENYCPNCGAKMEVQE